MDQVSETIPLLVRYFSFVGGGLFLSFQILIGGFFIGVALGLFFAVLRYKKIAVWLINNIISILRGTPVILQLSFIYFTTPALVGFKLSVVAAGIVTFGLNSSAYVAEIFRAGIEGMPKGQFEAAKTLDIPTYYMWKDIILPQVIRAIFPAMVSEVIALLKESAIISTIGGMDIMRKSQVLAAEQFTYFLPLIVAGVYYYVLVLLIEFIGRRIERRNAIYVES